MVGDREPLRARRRIGTSPMRAGRQSESGGTRGGRLQPRWEMVDDQRGSVPALGCWHLREATQQIGGNGLCFSADGRRVAVVDASRIIRLVETETGRTVARRRSPELCGVGAATFSPDGSRLAVLTNHARRYTSGNPAAIRRQLAEMGLDWDAPRCPERMTGQPRITPAAAASIDYGRLRAVIDQDDSHLE